MTLFVKPLACGAIVLEPDRFLEMMIYRVGFMQKLFAGLALWLGVILICVSSATTGLAEKLVDPSSVAPEYRAAAEKRRAEQIKLLECTKKADEAKVLRRDRVAYINECLDK
jgi:hypothetical protein